MKLWPVSTNRSRMRWASAWGVLPPMSMVPRQRRLTSSGPSATRLDMFIWSSFRTEGSGGPALDQRQRMDDLDRVARTAAELGKQQLHGVAADQRERLPDRRQPEDPGDFDVVEADDRQLA